MKSRDYWKKRSEAVASKQFKKTDDYILSMQLEYQEALNSIQKDIEVFYARFAANNEISLAEARKLLNSDELREFHMGLKEFTRKAKDNGNLQWEKELNNASYKVRVSRLQALETQINNYIEELYSKKLEGTTGLLGNIYEDTYHRNIYELHKGLGIVTNFEKLNTRTVDKAISEPWLGSNFSSRIWDDKEKLIRELRTNLTQAFIRGDSIYKTSKIIADRMDVDKNRARTLVNTESANITSKATFDSYSGSGVVKEYEILATLDLHTSKICRSMDGKVFNLNEKEIGLNAPPFHPNCRSTTVAYFDDDVDEERIARDSEGKVYYVDGNMNYEQWYDQYVKGNPKEEIAEKKIKNKDSDKKQYEKYREVLGNEAPKSFDKFQNLKYNDVKEWTTIKDYYKARSQGNISAFSSFSDYKAVKKELTDKLIGVKTADGIEIKSFSKHMIDRILGTSNDPKTGLPRSGTTVEGVLDALRNPVSITKTKARKLDKISETSKKYIGETTTVSINPITGNLIQSNPTSEKLVKGLKK